jgi:hypothetical protein
MSDGYGDEEGNGDGGKIDGNSDEEGNGEGWKRFGDGDSGGGLRKGQWRRRRRG